MIDSAIRYGPDNLTYIEILARQMIQYIVQIDSLKKENEELRQVVAMLQPKLPVVST